MLCLSLIPKQGNTISVDTQTTLHSLVSTDLLIKETHFTEIIIQCNPAGFPFGLCVFALQPLSEISQKPDTVVLPFTTSVSLKRNGNNQNKQGLHRQAASKTVGA